MINLKDKKYTEIEKFINNLEIKQERYLIGITDTGCRIPTKNSCRVYVWSVSKIITLNEIFDRIKNRFSNLPIETLNLSQPIIREGWISQQKCNSGFIYVRIIV
jgi:hypothetical protein